MRRYLTRAAEIMALAGGALLLAIVTVTVCNTGLFGLDRLLAILDGPSVPGVIGYEDLVGLASGSAVLLLLPYCQLHRGHLAIELFASSLPAQAGLWLDRLGLLVMATTALLLAIGLGYGMVELQGDGALSPVLGWPVWPFLLPGLAALALWSLIAAIQIAEPSAPEPGP
jgi:TRAP-type mannitol/chloroaromatic compound transport system permease small subunit